MTPEVVMWDRVPLLAALTVGCVVVPAVAAWTVSDGVNGLLAALMLGGLLPLLARRWVARIPRERRVAMVSAVTRVRLGPDLRISWRGATAWTSRLAVVAVAAAGLFFAGHLVSASWFAVAAGYLQGAMGTLDALQEAVDADLVTGS